MGYLRGKGGGGQVDMAFSMAIGNSETRRPGARRGEETISEAPLSRNVGPSPLKKRGGGLQKGRKQGDESGTHPVVKPLSYFLISDGESRWGHLEGVRG